jgi:hypothetical protein
VNYETSPFIPGETKKSIMESLETWWSEAFSDLQDALVTAGFYIDLSDIKTTYKRSRETFRDVDTIVVSDTITPLVDLREHGTKNTLRPTQTFTTITKLIIRYRRGSVVPK